MRNLTEILGAKQTVYPMGIGCYMRKAMNCQEWQLQPLLLQSIYAKDVYRCLEKLASGAGFKHIGVNVSGDWAAKEMEKSKVVVTYLHNSGDYEKWKCFVKEHGYKNKLLIGIEKYLRMERMDSPLHKYLSLQSLPDIEAITEEYKNVFYASLDDII